MLSKKLIILVSCLFLLLLSGCMATSNSESDAVRFLKSEYGIRDFEISDKYETIKGEDGLVDKLWTVRLPKEDITFHVLDDCFEGTFVKCQLRTDYDNAVTEKLFSSFPSVYLESGTDSGYDCFNGFAVIGTFSSRDEIGKLLDEYDAFREYIVQNGYDVYVKGRLVFDNPIRNNTSYIIDEGDFFLYHKASDSAYYTQFMNNYIKTVLDYRFTDNINELSAYEIESVLEKCKDRVSVLDSVTGEYRMYDDIVANMYGYGISFSSLYEILVREGYPVEGDAWDYTFSSPGGDIYEISYDFHDYPFEDGNGYYYLKNGEKQPMDHFFYNHFSTAKIYEMTGIKLKDSIE